MDMDTEYPTYPEYPSQANDWGHWEEHGKINPPASGTSDGGAATPSMNGSGSTTTPTNWVQTGVTALQIASSLASLFSDRRLKEHIVPVGTENGHKVYEFNYIGHPTKYRGVMAQDVLKTHPDAVVVRDGYLAVNYDAIGVQFMRV